MATTAAQPPPDRNDDADIATEARSGCIEPACLARLSQVAVSHVEVGALLDRYLREAVEATGATRGFVALAKAETGGLEVVATSGAGWTEQARRNRLALRGESGGTITVRVATTGKCVRLDDVEGAPSYQPFFPDIHAVLAVPIVEPGGRVRGVINLESTVAGEFGDREEAFVSVLADLAALRLAMDDLRTREAALVKIGKDLSIAAEADTLMRKVLDVAAEILRFEDCSLFIIDKATQRVVLAATRGSLASEIERAAYAIGEGLTGWVAEHGVPVRVQSPTGDPRHKGLHRELAEEETAAFLAVPIKAHTGVVGVLRVMRKKTTSPWFPNDFTEEDEQVLSTIASQVGAAIDNAQLVARLVQAERMAAWGEMSAMSSHMIGNRVFAIKGDLNELEHVLSKSETVRREDVAELVAGMKRGIFRLEELLGEFRDFVRATALSTVPLDLGDLVRGAVGETFPKRAAVELIEEYADEPLPVQADPAKLKRAFSEIIENAVTFQEQGGSLRVRTWRGHPDETLPARVALPPDPAYACVSFEDRGPGVPPANKDKIFRPFFTSRNRGMGLGLAIVKGIIEAHKGDIVEVGAPGGGARFVVFLPLREGVN